MQVNNAFGGANSGISDKGSFWDKPIAAWNRCHDVGLRSHFVCSHHAARVMAPAKRGLIVNISSAGGMGYFLDVSYGTGKAAVDRLSADMAHELRPHGVASVSLWPGLVSTEIVTGKIDGNTVELGTNKIPISMFETPELTGRVIAGMLAEQGSEALMARSGRVYQVVELAAEFGMVEAHGALPPPLIAPEAVDKAHPSYRGVSRERLRSRM